MGGKQLQMVLRMAPVLALVLYAEFVIAWFGRTDNASGCAIVRISAYALVYAMSGFLLRVFKADALRWLVVILTVWTCFECILGLLQIYGIIESKHQLYQVTGSFINPNPYAGFLAVSSSILAAYLWGHCKGRGYLRVSACVSLVLVLTVIPATGCRSAVCALIVALMLLLREKRMFGRMKVPKTLLVIALSCIMALMYLWKKPSADWRMFQNRISVMTILGNPFWGCGLGHYGGAVSATQLDYFKDILELRNGNVVIPPVHSTECRTAGWSRYAFCDPLQIGVEAGAFTMVTYLCWVAVSLMILYRQRSPLFYGLVALQVTSLFSYPLQMWQTGLLLAVMSGGAAGDGPVNVKTFLPQAGMVLVAAATLVCCFPEVREMKQSASEWESDRFFFNRGEYALYCRYCEKRIRHLGDNADFLLEYGLSLSKTGSLGKSDSVLAAGFLLSGKPAFQLFLGDNNMARGDYEAARNCYWNSFCAIPDRLLPLARLARAYKAQGRTDCLDSLVTFVDGFNMRIESDVTESLRTEIKKTRQ